MIMPLGTYITPKRLIGLAADVCSADSAGIMLSRSGSASIEPIPRSTVRRGIAIFEMIIARPFLPEACKPRQFLSRAAAVALSASPATAMLNGVLLTMPVMMADQE